MCKALFVVTLLAVASPAFAQGTGGSGGSGGSTTGSMGTGSCSGMLSGTVGLAVPQGSGGSLETVQSATIPYVFGNAECLCQSRDIELQVYLTQALPQGTLGTVEVWAGSGCDNYTTRSNPALTTCEKIATLDINQFVLGASSSGASIYIPVNATALMSPVVHTCSQSAISNQIYIFFYTDPSNPFATCNLPLNEANAGPAAATTVSASAGDGAITVSWAPPAATLPQPLYYQLLCADVDGNPVPGQPPSGAVQQYSACLPGGVLKRRVIPTGGTISASGSDGGVTTTTDAGTSTLARTESLLPDSVTDAGVLVSDGGTLNEAAGTPTSTTLPAPFTHLDPSFLCSDGLMIAGTSATARVDGLTNGKVYQFVVLAVDKYGNATPSAVVQATPQPAEDLYRRYTDAGGHASGFCFVATAAFGSYENRYVKVLRDFRDDALLPNRPGRAFVNWYYANSPPAAHFIATHPALRIATQEALWPLIGLAAAWLYLPAWVSLLLLLGAATWLGRRLRPRPRRA